MEIKKCVASRCNRQSFQNRSTSESESDRGVPRDSHPLVHTGRGGGSRKHVVSDQHSAIPGFSLSARRRSPVEPDGPNFPKSAVKLKGISQPTLFKFQTRANLLCVYACYLNRGTRLFFRLHNTRKIDGKHVFTGDCLIQSLSALT